MSFIFAVVICASIYITWRVAALLQRGERGVKQPKLTITLEEWHHARKREGQSWYIIGENGCGTPGKERTGGGGHYHRASERPLPSPGPDHPGRRRWKRVRAAGHGVRRPLPLRPLQEQALLRRHPPRGRLPGGDTSRAGGGVLGERLPSTIRYTFRSWKPALSPHSSAPSLTPPLIPIPSIAFSSSRRTSHTCCWPASTSTRSRSP